MGNDVVAITVSSLGSFLSSSDDGLVVDKLWSGSYTAGSLTLWKIAIGVNFTLTRNDEKSNF